MAQWFWRKRWKCEKFTDRLTKDNRRSQKVTRAFNSCELKKKRERLELIVTLHVKVYKNLTSFTEINQCDQASTLCLSSQCVPIPQKPYYFCTACPPGKTGQWCTIGKLLTIKRTRGIFCAEIVERTKFRSLPSETI